MCGITGLLYYNNNSDLNESTLLSMRDAMVHRGPDGGGSWVSEDKKVGFAHRRLSIIDLAQTAAQPMPNEDNSIWITFNGEIYNHLSLRAELTEEGHRFRTNHSDTEVIIHGYEQWGIDGLLERLEGDYAFAVYDIPNKLLYIARDRVGVKPLYFTDQQGIFIFASEIKAILKHPIIQRDIDPIAMYHYLSFLTTPSPLTMFKGINKLPAGYYLQINDNGEYTAKKYWEAVPGKGIIKSEIEGMSESAQEEFYTSGVINHLTDSVEKRMMSDVPYGVFLSGGVDSSTNVALMNEFTERPLETFTIGFKDHKALNELSYAKLVADTFKTNHHEILIDESDMVGYLDDLIYHQDEPIADWVCVPLHFVSKLTKDAGVTVAQVGEGSDEQFSGYSSYLKYLNLYYKYWQPFRKQLPQPLQKFAANSAVAFANHFPRHEANADIIHRAANDGDFFWSGATIFWESVKSKLINKSAIQVGDGEYNRKLLDCGILPRSFLKTDSAQIIKHYRRDDKNSIDPLDQMVFNEFQLRLPELLLMRVDKITMSNSLEARVPFLDHKLIEFTMDIPEKWKVRNGVSKYILKKAVEKLIPHDIIYRKKMGFAAPMGEWLRGHFGKKVEFTLMNSEIHKLNYFNKSYISELFAEHSIGTRDNSVAIWAIYNLFAWYDYWIENKS
jgi:asparagine synthase (glutamine-hydrolysing)